MEGEIGLDCDSQDHDLGVVCDFEGAHVDAGWVVGCCWFDMFGVFFALDISMSRRFCAFQSGVETFLK